MISQTPSGADANLNPRSKGKSIYLCTHYSSKGLRITSLGMISAKARDDEEGRMIYLLMKNRRI